MTRSSNIRFAERNTVPGRWFTASTAVGAVAFALLVIAGVAGSHSVRSSQAAALQKIQVSKLYASEGHRGRSGILTEYGILF